MKGIINILLQHKFHFWNRKDVKNLAKDLQSGAYTPEMAMAIVNNMIRTDNMVRDLDKEL